MFEQIAVTDNRRPWTFAASVTLQTMCVSAVIAASIALTESISVQAPHLPLPYFPPRDFVKIVSVSRDAGGMAAAPAKPRPFTAPARIPDRVATIQDRETVMTTGIPAMERMLEGSGTLLSIGISGSAPAPAAPPPAEKAVPAPQSKPVPVGGHVLEARIVKRVIPPYPVLAKQARISGIVRLAGVISREGSVKDLQVISGHPLLVKAAVDAVSQWLYQPTMLNGVPVEVSAPIEVRFTLTQ